MNHPPFSRRQILRITGVCMAVTAFARPAHVVAQAKMSQKAARYQDSPKGGKRCDKCKFFVKPASCKRVKGEISPAGWCMLFVAK